MIECNVDAYIAWTYSYIADYSKQIQDTRLRPDSKYLESADSFGEYVVLNPSKADIIWMPDIFIDQVNTKEQ